MAPTADAGHSCTSPAPRVAGVTLLVLAMIGAPAFPALGEPMRGVVRALNQASLSTDFPMRLVRLPFREGHAFRAGDVIAAFDCRRVEAERQVALSGVREAELNLSSQVKLDSYGAVGRNELEIARARLEKAKGEHRMTEIRQDDCIVKAPFTGRVADAPVRVWEFTAAQRPYLFIVEDGNLEVDFIVSSRHMASLKLGQEIEFRIDEIPGATGRAQITAVNPTVDPVSRTLRIVTKVVAAPEALAVGMSCTGEFSGSRR